MLEAYTFDASAAVGANGSATVAVSKTLTGRVVAIGYKYVSAPATTDVTVAQAATTNAPVITLASRANSNTDAWTYLTVAMTGGAAGDLQGGIPVSGEVTVTVAQADANKGCIVTLMVER